MNEYYNNCKLCPRECGASRVSGERGVCGAGHIPHVARAALHRWEEPIISGDRGSGTIFFSGCSLGCLYCQNREISSSEFGKPLSAEGLCAVMLRLEEDGAHNINFVTAVHHIPHVASAIRLARMRGLSVPIVYNSGGYERVESLRLLSGLVDVYLPDLKYYLPATAARLSSAPDYPSVARAAIDEMVSQVGNPIIKDGIMTSGVVVRLLLLPNHVAEAKLNLKYLYDRYGDGIYVSLMSQYTPMPGLSAPLDRRVTVREYEELVDYANALGVANAFVQERESAGCDFIPAFDGTGV